MKCLEMQQPLCNQQIIHIRVKSQHTENGKMGEEESGVPDNFVK